MRIAKRKQNVNNSSQPLGVRGLRKTVQSSMLAAPKSDLLMVRPLDSNPIAGYTQKHVNLLSNLISFWAYSKICHPLSNQCEADRRGNHVRIAPVYGANHPTKGAIGVAHAPLVVGPLEKPPSYVHFRPKRLCDNGLWCYSSI